MIDPQDPATSLTNSNAASAMTIPSRYQPPRALARWWMRLLALVGLSVSGFLFYVTFNKGADVPGCAPGSGCDTVLDSPWSQLAGVPVAAPAMMVYAGILAALAHIGPGATYQRQRGAWRILIVLAVIAAAAAAWFTGLQVLTIHAYCKYCLTAHVCSVLLAATIFTLAPIGRKRLLPDEPDDPIMIAPSGAAVLIVVGLLAAGLFAGAQQWQPPPQAKISDTDSPVVLADTDRYTYIIVPGHESDPVQLDRQEYPVLGSPTAPHMMVYLFDYTCPHCRVMHGMLDGARARFGAQLAVMALPTPMNSACNKFVLADDPRHQDACELAKLALRVWRIDRGKFAEFDRWLFEPESARSIDEARRQAAKLVGEQALRDAAADQWPNWVLQRDAELYGRAGAGAIPKLFIHNLAIFGRMTDPDELFDLLQTRLGLRPIRQ